ncbi:MAG: hypothetical protein AAGH78_01540 [Cyanobacteria bacterium P01_H01_bin.58]
MTAEKDPDLDQKIEQEIRQGRTFSLADVIGQEAGNFLKGESPVPKLLQVKTELIAFVEQHLIDSSGALQATLRESIQADDLLCSQHLDTPLEALSKFLQSLLEQETLLQNFVRRIDMKWGEIYDERPHFEKPGQPPHPADEYTYASVRAQLTELLAVVKLQSF